MVPRPSDRPVVVSICGVFQLNSILGTRKITTKEFDPRGLPSGGVHSKCCEEYQCPIIKTIEVIELSVGTIGSCSSLLITLGRHFSHLETLSWYEVSCCLHTPVSLNRTLFVGRIGLCEEDKFWI